MVRERYNYNVRLCLGSGWAWQDRGSTHLSGKSIFPDEFPLKDSLLQPSVSLWVELRLHTLRWAFRCVASRTLVWRRLVLPFWGKRVLWHKQPGDVCRWTHADSRDSGLVALMAVGSGDCCPCGPSTTLHSSLLGLFCSRRSGHLLVLQAC